VSLAAPLALVLLLVAAPLVWAFLARRRAPRRVVGSVILLRAAIAEARTRMVAPRLRHPLSLLLMLLALVAAVAGLSGPGCGERPDGLLVVVVDPSDRMGRTVREGGRTVLDVAREALDPHLERHRGPMVLVRAGPVPTVPVGKTGDAGPVRAALAEVTPGGDADVEAALALSATWCADPAADRLLWVSTAPIPPGAAGDCPARTLDLPAPRTDLGIAALAVREGDALGLLEVGVAVAGNAPEPRSVQVAVRADGRLVDRFTVDVPPEGVGWSLRRVEAAGDAVEAALLDHADSRPANDRAVVVRTPRVPVRVGLVTDHPRGFLATALGLHPGVDLEVAPPATAETLGARDLIVMEAVPDPLPTAPLVVAFGAEPARALGLGAGTSLEAPRLTRWAFDHPLLRYVDLDGVVFRRAVPLVRPGDGEALIDVEGRPVAVTGTAASRRVVALGFGPGDTDLPLRVGFLHLLANLVEAADPGAEAPPPARVGRVWAPADPASRLVPLDGSPVPGWAPMPPAETVTVVDPEGSEVAVVAPGPPSPDALTPPPGQRPPVATAAGAGGVPWWVWAVLLALGALLAETALTAGLGWAGRLLGGAR
jgi:hypothetical protein